MRFSHMNLDVFFSSFWIHAISLLMFFSSISSAVDSNGTDQLALLQFKAKITKDPLGVLNSWNDTINFCQWYGVKCGRRHQRVTRLVLDSLQLSGSISPHIGNLSFLRTLGILNNSISEEIPSEIGHLQRLERFYLTNNSFSGEIPWNISSCSNLKEIVFYNNHLVGEIPASLGSLLKLRVIDLGKNKLTGNIPSSFGNLSSLETLDVSINNLGGIIPDSLGQLKNLSSLFIYVNRLNGTIPPSIFNLSSIMMLDVSGNLFHGTLPSHLGVSLPKLQFFSIAQNQFTGSIPVSISNASLLESLQLTGNKLQGRVPSLSKLSRLRELRVDFNDLGSVGGDDLGFLSSLVNATTLQILTIQRNNFVGMLPQEICNLTELITFFLNDNQIYGSIPTGIVNLVNLHVIGAANNHLSGVIPPNIGMLQNLVGLDLDNNMLTGYIPSSFGNLTNLSVLYLAGNNLQGNIPSDLSNSLYLQILDLSSNNLSGIIPREILMDLFSSLLIDFSSNHLTGSLPMEVEKLIGLEALNLSENMLSGEIPSSLSSCISLESLYMEGNFFHGPIPSSLSSLRGLQELDLSRNNLSGNIPKFLGDFDLHYLNLSFNDFDGEVPTKGVFKNASATTVIGNNKLCGGILEFHLPKCKNSNKRRLTNRIKIIVAIVSVLSGVILVLFFIYLLWFRKKRKQPVSGSSGPLLWRVSYQGLLKATDGFSSSNLIGVGSYGTVYKGILDQGRTLIAVKVLNLLRRGASRSFMSECEALRTLRHRNLVKVLTACSSVDYDGNDFKALVYEYMVNGSLEDWLHPNAIISEVNEAPRNLDFLQRLTIAIDIARALEYLHHHCETPVVHCDLKPNNVLLDDEMTAHVGDFGLAKFLSQHGQDVVTQESSSIGVRGKTGYASPEYGMGSEVSTYGDVYSYGILLLEMFTGRRPTDDIYRDGLNIHNFAKAYLPDRTAEITDPVLLGEIEEGEMSTIIARNQNHPSNVIQEGLNLIIEIGVACSQDFPGERMSISEVATKLYFLREKLVKTRIHGERRHAQNIR